MKKKILIILFIIISILLVFIGYKFTKNIAEFRSHREYFKKPLEEQKIEDWMSLNYIKKRYLIDIERIVWNDVSVWDMNITIKEYCKKNKINCNELIISLEKYKNGD